MNNDKMLTIRLPKEIWVFMKREAVDQETSMNEIILECLKKYKKNREKVLTD